MRAAVGYTLAQSSHGYQRCNECPPHLPARECTRVQWSIRSQQRCGRPHRQNRDPVQPAWWLLATERRFELWARRRRSRLQAAVSRHGVGGRGGLDRSSSRSSSRSTGAATARSRPTRSTRKSPPACAKSWIMGWKRQRNGALRGDAGMKMLQQLQIYPYQLYGPELIISQPLKREIYRAINSCIISCIYLR